MFAKLFSSITESSLWSEPKEVRLLFVTMLAKADQNGFIEASIPGLARVANLSFEETVAALECLMSPDQYSKNPDNEGRRVLQVPGGFALLNYEDYRARRSNEERQEYMRNYMKDYRKQRKQSVNSGKQSLATVSRGKPRLAQAEAEAEAEEEADYTHTKDLQFSKHLISIEFTSAWDAWKAKLAYNNGGPMDPITEQAQLYTLEGFDTVEAIEIVRFSTSRRNCNNLITNGDHKAKPSAPSAGRGKMKIVTD